jgi:internalin A
MAEPAEKRIQKVLASGGTELDLTWSEPLVPEHWWLRPGFQELVNATKLRALPESIAQLSELRLCDNELLELPEFIAQLKQLQNLDAAYNRLTRLPQSLGHLKQLRMLNASNNQLSELPESLRQLSALRELYLHGNEQLGIPAEVLGPTLVEVRVNKAAPANPASILDYYFRTRDGSQPLNEAKLILVGRGEVGKTCIVKRCPSSLVTRARTTRCAVSWRRI